MEEWIQLLKLMTQASALLTDEDPTRENGATREPINIDLQMENSLYNKSIILQIDRKSQQVSTSALSHSLQDRLSKGSGKSHGDEIYLKLHTCTVIFIFKVVFIDCSIFSSTLVGKYMQFGLTSYFTE
ncbi:Dynamin-2B [Platanthera zijinensis]|uniref:Dynamin-2B n=1 Tax=Platanthera zijinensis TaxID=2320716 RepID=A0AAP0BAX3_9ASPA